MSLVQFLAGFTSLLRMEKKYNINQRKGLSNNTALSIFEDFEKNVWVGLDNGINCINMQSHSKLC
jgi:hypothetical protein